MPQRRRLPTPSTSSSAVAKLAPQRLPLGTPTLVPEQHQPRTRSRLVPSGPLYAPSSLSICEVSGSAQVMDASETVNLVDQDTSAIQPSDMVVSLAEAKLRRQNERIKEAEAALSASSTHVRFRADSNARLRPEQQNLGDIHAHTLTIVQHEKLTALEALDNTHSDPLQSQERHSPPVASALENAAYHAKLEGHHLDMDLADDTGFQVYTNRRNRKASSGHSERQYEDGHLSAEAPHDEHAMCQVFGNSLPGPQFIEQNVGDRNGQLQFIQHPNGDVSAHLWSVSKYVWEHIGQYLNSSKRIEGSLAVDDLRDHAAAQTVEQHSLALFRLLAKQREADAVDTSLDGVFKAKLLLDAGAVIHPVVAAGADNPQGKLLHDSGSSIMQAQQNTEPVLQNANNLSQAMTNHEDPFTSAQPPHPGRQSLNPSIAPWTSVTVSSSMPHHASRNIQLQASVGRSYDASTLPSQQGHVEPGSSTNPADLQLGGSRNRLHEMAHSHAQNLVTSAKLPHRRAPFAETTMNGDNERTSNQHEPHGLNPLGSNPSQQTRCALRDHLVQIGLTAEQRKLSAVNARTVLYDPFQGVIDKGGSVAESREGPAEQQGLDGGMLSTAGPSSGVLDNQGAGTISYDPRNASMRAQMPTTMAMSKWNDRTIPWRLGHTRYEAPHCRLRLTSGAPGIDHSLSNVHQPQNLRDWHLANWYWSGNKFERHDELCRRLHTENGTMTAFQTNNDHQRQTMIHTKALQGQNHTSSSSSQAAQLEVGPPQSPIYESMTRLLIPVCENLASYVQGSPEIRHDYWCRWTQAPEWAIDRSATGNSSFFDQPTRPPCLRPAQHVRQQQHAVPADLRFGAFSSPVKLHETNASNKDRSVRHRPTFG